MDTNYKIDRPATLDEIRIYHIVNEYADTLDDDQYLDLVDQVSKYVFAWRKDERYKAYKKLYRTAVKIGVTVADRPVVAAALARDRETNGAAMAIELPDGSIVTGRNGSMMGAAAGALMNAMKALAGIQTDIDLIAPIVLQPIRDLKTKHFGSENPRLHSDELLYALSICATTNPTADRAMKVLDKLKGLEAHSTVMLSRVDLEVYRRLGINLTCEPERKTNRLFDKN